MLEVDRGPVAVEQDHRVVDQAGQDPVEIEPAADVGRHPAQRLGAVEQVGHLVGPLSTTDDRPDRVGRDAGQLEVRLRQRAGALADHEQDTPWRARPGDRHGELGMAVGQEARAALVAGFPDEHAGQRSAARPPVTGGEVQRPTEDPERARHVHQAADRARLRGRDGSRHQPHADELPDRHQVMPVRIAERLADGEQDVVGVVACVDQAGQRRRDLQVEVMTLDVERIGTGDRELRPARGREAGDGRRVDRASSAPRPGRHRRHAIRRPRLGGGHEPLQVAQPVAAVTARIDPVRAQPAGIAPRPDRVRVHAKQPRGLGDREGRVRRA